MKRLRLVPPDGAEGEPSAAEAAAIAALTAALGKGMQRGALLFEDADGNVQWEYICTGQATMRGLVDVTHEALHLEVPD